MLLGAHMNIRTESHEVALVKVSADNLRVLLLRHSTRDSVETHLLSMFPVIVLLTLMAFSLSQGSVLSFFSTPSGLGPCIARYFILDLSIFNVSLYFKLFWLIFF